MHCCSIYFGKSVRISVAARGNGFTVVKAFIKKGAAVAFNKKSEARVKIALSVQSGY